MTPGQPSGPLIPYTTHFRSDFTLTVTATSTESNGGDTETTVDTIDVTVTAVADAPNLTVADASGNEDTAIPLSIRSAERRVERAWRLPRTITWLQAQENLTTGSK